MKRTHKVQGMSCLGCARSLKSALARHNVAIELTDIDVQRGLLVVDASANQEDVVHAIVEAGFDHIADHAATD